MGLTSRLSHRITVYAREQGENDSEEIDYTYAPVKTVWAAIIAMNGSTETLPGDSIRAKVTHKFTLRHNALPEIQTDMYFMMQGQKYEVLYWYPDYKYNDRVQVFCRLEVEA